MPAEWMTVSPVLIPVQSNITGMYSSIHLADGYAIALPAAASTDPEVLARFMFAHQPAWISKLMGVRDTLVAWLGLKTGKHLKTLEHAARAERVGIFKIYSRSDTEIVVGEDDKHLDFRVSVLRSSGPTLTVSTVVHCHNLLGRVYLVVIAPFHRMVVKASLRRAAQIGWPQAGIG